MLLSESEHKAERGLVWLKEAINILRADRGRIVDTKSNPKTLRTSDLTAKLDYLTRALQVLIILQDIGDVGEEIGPGKFLIRQLGRDR